MFNNKTHNVEYLFYNELVCVHEMCALDRSNETLTFGGTVIVSTQFSVRSLDFFGRRGTVFYVTRSEVHNVDEKVQFWGWGEGWGWLICWGTHKCLKFFMKSSDSRWWRGWMAVIWCDSLRKGNYCLRRLVNKERVIKPHGLKKIDDIPKSLQKSRRRKP